MVKAASVYSATELPKRVCEMDLGAESCQVVDEIAIDRTALSKSIVRTPKAPLRALTTVGATIDLRILYTIRATNNESGPILRPLILTLNDLAPRAPRCDFTPYFYIIDTFGIVYDFLVRDRVYHSHHGFLLSCFISCWLRYSCQTSMSRNEIFFVL